MGFHTFPAFYIYFFRAYKFTQESTNVIKQRKTQQRMVIYNLGETFGCHGQKMFFEVWFGNPKFGP